MLLFIKPFCSSEDNPHEMCVEHCGCKYGNTIATRQELSDAGWVTVERRTHHEDVQPKVYVRCGECAEMIVDACEKEQRQHYEGYEIEDHRPNPFFDSFYPQPEIIEL